MDISRASCRDNPQAYALAFSPDINKAMRFAIDYCRDCPIRLDCLLEAVHSDAYGIWGGTTRATRLELKANGL